MHLLVNTQTGLPENITKGPLAHETQTSVQQPRPLCHGRWHPEGLDIAELGWRREERLQQFHRYTTVLEEALYTCTAFYAQASACVNKPANSKRLGAAATALEFPLTPEITASWVGTERLEACSRTLALHTSFSMQYKVARCLG